MEEKYYQTPDGKELKVFYFKHVINFVNSVIQLIFLINFSVDEEDYIPGSDQKYPGLSTTRGEKIEMQLLQPQNPIKQMAGAHF